MGLEGEERAGRGVREHEENIVELIKFLKVTRAQLRFKSWGVRIGRIPNRGRKAIEKHLKACEPCAIVQIC
jgi:hypothetical protein